MTMNLRMWARGTAATSLVSFYTASQGVDGFDSSTAGWPDGYVHYLIQRGVLWELGVGEVYTPGFLEEEPGGPPAPVKHMHRRAVTANSAGTTAFIDFGGELCDVAFSHTAMLPHRRWWMLYGDGSDGDVTLSGAVTLTRTMYYRNLALADDAVVSTGSHAIYVSDKLTLPDSRSTANPVFNVSPVWVPDNYLSFGGSGGFGASYFSPGPGNPAGSGVPGDPVTTYRLGGLGGEGGGGQNAMAPTGFWEFGAGGGFGGQGNALEALLSIVDIEAVIGGTGGGGGGGGGASSTDMFSSGGAGGSGGSGGGVLRIHARVIDGGAWAGAPLLLGRCTGTDGSVGSPRGSANAGDGGDGGGGGGGALVLVSDYINRLPWYFQADGGAPGGISAAGGQGGAAYVIVRSAP